MRRATLRSTFLVLLCQALACAEEAPPSLCSPATTTACQCEGGTRSGRASCNAEGSAFGTCDCSASACAPMASQRCEGHHLLDLDACGNPDPIPAMRCTCPCLPGSTTCPGWQEPAALTPAPSCHVATSCLAVEHLHCAPLGGGWAHGQRTANGCGFAVRCYVYSETSRIEVVADGWREWRDRGYTGPPLWPLLDPGQEATGYYGYATEAECRSRWDARSVTELGYFACVRADDPPASCLPDLADWLASLAPVCGAGG